MEPRKISAKECITAALVELMKEKPFEAINVSEICERAGYNRVTYYRNFSSKEDILKYMLEGIRQDFAAGMVLHRGRHFAPSAARMFELIGNYADEILLLHKARMDFLLLETLDYAFLPTIPDEVGEHPQYSRAFQSGGYFYILLKWLLGGRKESPEEMGQILADVVEGSTIY